MEFMNDARGTSTSDFLGLRQNHLIAESDSSDLSLRSTLSTRSAISCLLAKREIGEMRSHMTPSDPLRASILCTASKTLPLLGVQLDCTDVAPALQSGRGLSLSRASRSLRHSVGPSCAAESVPSLSLYSSFRVAFTLSSASKVFPSRELDCRTLHARAASWVVSKTRNAVPPVRWSGSCSHPPRQSQCKYGFAWMPRRCR
mmetsp:Transcript_3556/g.14002  ORF Transcript_3556/g.14002 Transcript_3556/m.14002 type:complete len:201 (-) Transcript_3556:318-920(-)